LAQLSESEMRTVALVRQIPRTFAAHAVRSDWSKPINQALASKQHERYCDILGSVLGKENVIHVKTRDDLADSVFVEDTAVVLRQSKYTVATSIAVESRKGEAADVLDTFRSKCNHEVINGLESGEFLDGGDVLFTGKLFLIGVSKRTNMPGALKFAKIITALRPEIPVEFITVPFGLHLKSICSMFGNKAIIASSQCSQPFLAQLELKSKISDIILVPNPEAANCVWIQLTNQSKAEDHIIVRKEFPHSLKILHENAKRLGIDNIHDCEATEVSKADGALTCCSVIMEH